MPTFRKIEPGSEKELHTVIEKEIEALEDGLVILKYEFNMESGIPDFLCVDSGGRLVIIEVKTDEDENILFQSMRYYNELDKKRFEIAKIFADKRVDPSQHPRIILIAKQFSDDIRRLSTLIKPDVELYIYDVVLSTSDNKMGIVYHEIYLPETDEAPSKPTNKTDIRDYITNEKLKSLFDKIIKDVESIAEGEISSYATQGYVGFKYKGKMISWLSPRRQAIVFGSYIFKEGNNIDNEDIRIEVGTEDYSVIIEKIKKSIEDLGYKAR